MYGNEVPMRKMRVAAFDRLMGRPGAEQADAAGRVGAVVRHAGLAQQRLDDRRRQRIGKPFQLVGARPSAPRPARMTIFLPAFSSSAARAQVVRRRQSRLERGDVGSMVCQVARTAFVARRQRLEIDREVDVGDAVPGKSLPAGQVGHVAARAPVPSCACCRPRHRRRRGRDRRPAGRGCRSDHGSDAR